LKHSTIDLVPALRALSNDKRVLILQWLKDPRAHFREQQDGDLVKDGVCGVLIAEKLGISQPTLSEHMRVLVQSGLVTATRIKQWTFYKRNEQRIRATKGLIASAI
jgi:ArsR family transcriptional regulator